nr:hypothetical protein [Tanacetum cinerariifolium]
MDSKNNNEKVNLPSLLSPETIVSCFDDLDFFKDFENEFPAIVYNDAQTSKSDLLAESILIPQHIDEFDLNGETSLSKYDEEEQNILYFNDLLPFNIIHPNDLKSEKDNDDNDIDIIQSSGDMALLPHDQWNQYLRREVHRVQVFDFRGPSDLMAEGLSARMLMEYKGAQGVSLFTSGPGGGYLISGGRWLFHRLIACSIARRSQAHEKGLTVISPELSIIDMAELVRLEICMEVDDTWAWVAMGLERHPDAEGGTSRVAQDTFAVDEGVQAVSTPMHTYGEIDDRSGEILHIDDFMYGTADGGEWANIPDIRWDFLRELTCGIPKTHQAEDW